VRSRMAENTTNGNLHLTSGRLLARNTVWNLIGQVVPMVVGLVTVPFIIRGMGVERFGVLSLAWIVVGYFSLFDLGIGRALTKLVADKLASKEEQVIPSLVWTSLLLLFVLGMFGGMVTAALSPLLVRHLLKVPLALQSETLHGFYLLAASMPVVTTTAGFRGVLEALQRFRVANLIRMPMSVFSLVGPLLILPFSHSLVPIIGTLMAARVIGCVVHLIACIRAVPALGHNFGTNLLFVGPLFRNGGWMTLCNVVGPVILYIDRFLIGAVLSLSAVGYYTAPFDVLSRLNVIPAAIAGVLFPAFALSVAQDPNRTGLLLARGTKYVFLALYPVVLLIVMFGPEMLQHWLGASFAERSGVVLPWLAVGMLMSCLTVVPFASLQGIGKSNIAGIFLLIDLPIYLTVAFVLTKRMGIEGTAVSWAGRTTLEVLVLFVLNRRFLPARALPLGHLGICMVAALSVLPLSLIPASPLSRAAFVLLAFVAFLSVSWFYFLEPEERAFLIRWKTDVVGMLSGNAISATGGRAAD
jgi:O-antigen/teichoic acid export membrane protein